MSGHSNEPPENDLKKRDPSRRAFVKTAGMIGVATAARPWDVVAETTTRVEEVAAGNAVSLTMRVNGKGVQLHVDSRTSLLDCLREKLALTGTKQRCDH